MPASGRGTTQVPATPAVSGGASIARGFTLNATFAGLTDVADASVVFGVAASTPATFADLAHTSVRRLTEADRLNFTTPDETIYHGSLFIDGGMVAGIVAGDHFWCCLAESASPSSGTALVVLAGPITVTA